MDLFTLTGKVALVTGGNGGIGLGIAHGLAAAGAAVAVAGRNQAKSEAAAKALASERGVRAMAVQVDVTNAAAVRAAVARVENELGRLDILVNNAGTNIRGAPEETTLEQWHEVIDTNLTSTFVCCQAALEPMKRAGGGKIVNIGSMTSIFGVPFAVPYAASKGGVVQLTKSLALAWAKFNIQVNCILPGWIDTELTRKARQQVPGLHERVEARTPQGRWGIPAELAGAAVFYASRASDFVTGTVLPVDGGYSAA